MAKRRSKSALFSDSKPDPEIRTITQSTGSKSSLTGTSTLIGKNNIVVPAHKDTDLSVGVSIDTTYNELDLCKNENLKLVYQVNDLQSRIAEYLDEIDQLKSRKVETSQDTSIIQTLSSQVSNLTFALNEQISRTNELSKKLAEAQKIISLFKVGINPYKSNSVKYNNINGFDYPEWNR